MAAPWRWAHNPQQLATLISSLCSACTWLPERPTDACLQDPVKLQSKHYAFWTVPHSRGQGLDSIVLMMGKASTDISATSHVEWAKCDDGPTLPKGHSRLPQCSSHAAHEQIVAVALMISILACNDIILNWTQFVQVASAAQHTDSHAETSHIYLVMADHMLDSKCSLRGFGRIASWNRNISHCSQAAGDSLQPCKADNCVAG